MLTLTDDELNGEPVKEEELMYEVVHKRKILILGDNFPKDSRSIASNFCCALKLKQAGSELVKELNEDTAESLLKKSDN